MKYMKISQVLQDLAEQLETGNLPPNFLARVRNRYGLNASYSGSESEYFEFHLNDGKICAVRRYLENREYPFQTVSIPGSNSMLTVSTAFWLTPSSPTKGGYAISANPYCNRINPPEGRKDEYPDLWFYLTTGVSIENIEYRNLHLNVLMESMGNQSVQEAADEIAEAFLQK